MAEKITNKLKFCIHDLCYRNRIVFQIGALQITFLRDVTPPLYHVFNLYQSTCLPSSCNKCVSQIPNNQSRPDLFPC